MNCNIVGNLAWVMIFLLGGCGAQRMYSGAGQGSRHVAIIYAHGVAIHRVNGIPFSANSNAAEVLPGRTEVLFTINSSNFTARLEDTAAYKLVFNAEEGKEYSVTTQRGDGRVCAWEISAVTGKPDFGKSAGCFTRQ